MKKNILLMVLFIALIIFIPSFVKIEKFDRADLVLDDLNSWNFFVVSDMHSGENLYRDIFSDIEKENFDFLFINGDIVNLGFGKEYQRVETLLSGYDFPIYTSIGNHERWFGGVKYYKEVFGDLFYSFYYKNIKFIVLDSSLGYIEDEQLKWFEEELESSETEEIIVFSHISPIDTVTGEFDDNFYIFNQRKNSYFEKSYSDQMLDLCSQYGVDYYISGHIHAYSELEINGVKYISSGTIGHNTVAYQGIGYLKFSIVDNQITYKYVDRNDIFKNEFLRFAQKFVPFVEFIFIYNWFKIFLISMVFTINLFVLMKKKYK